MKNLRKLSVLIGLAFLLNGCIPIYETSYTYIPPKSFRGRQCVNECLAQKSDCQSRCSFREQRCRMQAQRNAYFAYHEYAREQRRQNLPVVKTIDDFADYSYCSSNCGCESDYRQCYSNCGGKVIPHTRCIAFCKNQNP